MLGYSVQTDVSPVPRELHVWGRETTIIRPSEPSRGGGDIGAGAVITHWRSHNQA